MSPQKIRVLHIIKSLGRGGAEMLLPETLRLHRKDLFEFHYIYFLPWKDAMVNAIEMNGGKVVCFSSRDNFQIILKIFRVMDYVRTHRVQLIHAHLPWAGVVARCVGRLTGVPVIYTEHNKQERYHFLTRWMNVATMDLLSRMVAVSGDVEASIRKHKPKLKIPVRTVVNGVDTGYFAPGLKDGMDIRSSLNIPASSPVIGTIAVFRFQKRLEIWLEVAKRIAQQIPATRFVIVGDGPLKEKLHAHARALGIDQQVYFAGLQTEVRPYLAAMDLYMMSSVFEGLPVALLEAMACGCAVITTDAGGIKEVIRHDQDGLICPAAEPEKLAAYAVELLNDPAKRQRLAAQARKRVEENFSLETMVRTLETLYHTTLLQHRTGTSKDNP